LTRKRLLLAGVFVASVLACYALLLFPRMPKAGPSFLKGATVDDGVRAILVRSCSDCHSDGTRYPWYSFLPVVSGVIDSDVARGREQLNLSRWSEYSRLRRQRALTGIANQVRDRIMPLPNYVLLHPSARLSGEDIEAVFQWAQQERLRLILQSGNTQP
jgi:hypothetical protein